MSKRDTERLLDEIAKMAAQLGQGDESLSGDEVRSQLREGGIDTEVLKVRFHEMAKRLAERERQADRPVPLSLKQAIDATRSGGEMPTNPVSARAFAERWLERFCSAFTVPQNLEPARAYRKTGDVSERDTKELDRLERELKEKVQRENDGEA